MAGTWGIVKNLWDTFDNNPDNQRTVDAMKGMLGLLPAGAGDVASGLLAADDVRRGDYTSAALNGVGVLPFIPSMAGMVKGKGDDIAKAIRQPTKYEQAHEVARQNAVKMLGLPENNTAMDRAKALGYTTDAYHGTGYDVPYFDLSLAGQATDTGDFGRAVYTSPTTEIPNAYAAGKSPNVMPLKVKIENPLNLDNWLENPIKDFPYDKVYKDADAVAGSIKKHGYDSVIDFTDGANEVQMAHYSPNNIRSRFAAFDPARINEPDLLGRVNPELLPWLTGAGLLGAGGMYYSGE